MTLTKERVADGTVKELRTHCLKGHPLSGDNQYASIRKRDGLVLRQCRMCKRDRMRSYRARKGRTTNDGRWQRKESDRGE